MNNGRRPWQWVWLWLASLLLPVHALGAAISLRAQPHQATATSASLAVLASHHAHPTTANVASAEHAVTPCPHHAPEASGHPVGSAGGGHGDDAVTACCPTDMECCTFAGHGLVGAGAPVGVGSSPTLPSASRPESFASFLAAAPTPPPRHSSA